MTTLRIDGYINQDGELEIQIPPDHPVGKVTVTIEPVAATDDTEWTDEELDALLHPPESNMTNAEIIQMIHDFGPTGWDKITDSEAWVDEQRRRRREQSRW